jgi:PTH1 family peptidyl-tRNA hydrolase
MGFMVMEALRQRHGAEWVGLKGHSMFARLSWSQREVGILCPLTYMNLSGRAVSDALQWMGLLPEDILVVHDDLDMDLGRLKLVMRGGSGGHRGVESIFESIGTDEVPRLKLGIGRPRFGEGIADYVLSPFYEDELALVERVIDKAAWACELVVFDGLSKAMSKVNCLNLKAKEE